MRRDSPVTNCPGPQWNRGDGNHTRWSGRLSGVRRLLVAVVVLAMTAAACGDTAAPPTAPPTSEPPATTGEGSPSTTSPPATTTPDTGTGQLVRADVPYSTNTTIDDEQLAALVTGDIEFALDLLRSAADGGNAILSPFSIAAALTMSYAGARGVTAQQMRDVLHIVLPDDAVHEARNELSLRIADVPERDPSDDREPMRANIANSLWGQVGFPFEEAFLETLSSAYDAGVRLVDFIADAEGARTDINEWVADETEDRIQDLLPPGSVDTTTRLVLTNAIWFKAAWWDSFDPDRTEPGVFHTYGGENVTVPMMHGGGRMGFSSGDGFEAVRLVYAGGASMLIIAPAAGRFDDVMAGLDAPQLAAIEESMSTHQVTITMPKFEFETTLSLKGTLGDLGMTDAFAPDVADFSGISEAARDLHIQDVLHKAFISVDEEGTEAAAATAVVVGVTSAVPGATITLDNPFIFLIRNDSTGEILFAGTVGDPT